MKLIKLTALSILCLWSNYTFSVIGVSVPRASPARMSFTPSFRSNSVRATPTSPPSKPVYSVPKVTPNPQPKATTPTINSSPTGSTSRYISSSFSMNDFLIYHILYSNLYYNYDCNSSINQQYFDDESEDKPCKMIPPCEEKK